jgi:adenylate cyclase
MRALTGKAPGEPLTPEDWEAFYRHHTATRPATRLLSALPSAPRCRICGAPFAGPGRRVLGPLGYRPSRKNPHICSNCIESAPPGGMTMDVGVLFADVRGFTRLAETTDPHHLSELLRRFYAEAENALFPQAVVDKLIGDAVMALYIPMLGNLRDPQRLMLEQARELLVAVGYGTPGGPFVGVGVGLDFGPAFVGNIGKRWLYDFTAVGDVVNTAFRLQSEAGGGEILLSSRLADRLGEAAGERVEVPAKGKASPLVAYRTGW